MNVTVHVLAAFLWLGGVFFLAAVGAPVLRRIDPPELRAELFRRIGEQFRKIGWATLVVLLITGALNLQFRGLLSADVLGDEGFWRTAYGHALAWKLAAVAAMLIVQAVHDFVVGPVAARLPASSPDLPRARRRAALLGRLGALLGVIIVFAAVRLARGG